MEISIGAAGRRRVTRAHIRRYGVLAAGPGLSRYPNRHKKFPVVIHSPRQLCDLSQWRFMAELWNQAELPMKHDEFGNIRGSISSRGRRFQEMPMGIVVILHAPTRLKLKTERSALKPRRLSSSAKIGKYSAGITPLFRQLLTADTPTAVMPAAAEDPPTASMTSSTEQSMSIDSSETLNLSRVHGSEIDSSRILKSIMGMPADHRDRIAFRLDLLPTALGKPRKEIYEAAGMSKSGWSNVTSLARPERIAIDPALELWETFGISIEWMFKGDYNTILDQDLRTKLKLAEREAIKEAKHEKAVDNGRASAHGGNRGGSKSKPIRQRFKQPQTHSPQRSISGQRER